MAKITLSGRETRLACLRVACAAFCAAIALYCLGKPSAPVFFWVSVMFCAAGLVFPAQAGFIFTMTGKIFSLLGKAALALFYFIVLTPLALLFRAGRQTKARMNSCWVSCEEKDKESFERQY